MMLELILFIILFSVGLSGSGSERVSSCSVSECILCIIISSHACH